MYFKDLISLNELTSESGFRLSANLSGAAGTINLASGGDVNGDGLSDIIIGISTASSENVFVVFGKEGGLSDLSLTALDPDTGFRIEDREPNSFLGDRVELVQDFDGDGISDIFVSAPGLDETWPILDDGRAYLISGSQSLGQNIVVSDTITGTDGTVFSYPYTPPTGDFWIGTIGNAIGSGDFNGDGLSDLVFGDHTHFVVDNETGLHQTGAVHIVFGGELPVGTVDPSMPGDLASKTLLGNGVDSIGIRVASAGDINGDGFDDLLLASQKRGSDVDPSLFVVFGGISGFSDLDLTSLLPDQGFQISSTLDSEKFDLDKVIDTHFPQLSKAGDLNGDGLADFAVNRQVYEKIEGDPNNAKITNEVFVVYGKNEGFASFDLSDLTEDNGLLVTNSKGQTGREFDVSSAGDFNGDGIDDLLIGDGRATGSATISGEAYIIYGKEDGPSSVDIANLSAKDGVTLNPGTNWGSRLGESVTAIGDINGDGFDDVALGTAHGYLDKQEVFVVYGRPGRSGGPLDVDGDDTNNVIVGSDFVDTLRGLGGNDVLYGAAADDFLDGGTGEDEMFGGLGDDIFVVDEKGDIVTELAEEGLDTVQTTLAKYTLANTLENLEFTGTGSFVGNGNTEDNTLIGSAGDDTLRGYAGNDFLDGKTGADKTVGGDGDDIHVVDNAGDKPQENADGGTDTIQTTLANYALNNNFEILSFTGTGSFGGTGNGLGNTITGGSGDDTLQGLGGTDLLIGNAGNDTLDGGNGVDETRGGKGDDTHIVASSSDIVTELSGEGVDTVKTTLAKYSLGDHLEVLSHIGTKNFAGKGNTLNNTISGAEGNDTLDGVAGSNTLVGGKGNDIYTARAGDTITEFSGEGTDRIRTELASFTLGAEVENLSRLGTASFDATGNTLANEIKGAVSDDTLTGLEGDDTLFGFAGNDTLDGGTGADDMRGSAGDDLYIVDNIGDVVTESVGPTSGSDRIHTSLNVYELHKNVEALLFTGVGDFTGMGRVLKDTITGAAGNDFLKGLDGNDVLHGNAGNDTLDGGRGRDTLFGGSGDDIYFVDSVKDLIEENLSEGNDTVQTTLKKLNLSSQFANVENVVYSGTEDFTGFGNSSDNTLTGSVGDDTLSGRAGADTLVGGLGDDAYVFDTDLDHVIELADGGTDTVFIRSVSFDKFRLSENVENAILSNLVKGVTVRGNVLNNAMSGSGESDTLVGGDGDDTLIGNGGDDSISAGAGKDQLFGGKGNDTLRGGSDTDIMVGGVGNDTYFVDDSSDIVTELAKEGQDTVFTQSARFILGDNVENLVATSSKSFDGVGNSLDNNLKGHNKSATNFDGGAGNDTIKTGSKNDLIEGGTGADSIDASSGDDTVFGGDGKDYILGGKGSDSLFGGTGNDSIYADKAAKSGGNNILDGGIGNDTLQGGGGKDTVIGGEGKDRLIASKNTDIMTGGSGKDTFVMINGSGGNDIISDFVIGVDVIQVALVGMSFADVNLKAMNSGANTRVTIADQSFVFEDIAKADINASAGIFDFA